MDEARGEETDPTFRLMYRSHNLLPVDTIKVGLGHLFSSARAANKARHVTGALLLSGGSFVQVLEGDEAVVRALFARISTDPRHDQVELVEAGQVERREFARWSMAQVQDDGEIPLIAHTDGISAAAGHRITPGQREVLDDMRACVNRSRQA